jgi:hypothetical protein
VIPSLIQAWKMVAPGNTSYSAHVGN